MYKKKYPVIIFEGLEASGKSTNINNFSNLNAREMVGEYKNFLKENFSKNETERIKFKAMVNSIVWIIFSLDFLF